MAKNTKENTPPLTPNSDLREQIERTVGEVVPQANRQLVIERVVTLMSKESFSGPLPHPKHLSEYERISPGAADRIITMAEESQGHIQELDRKIISSEVSDKKIGLYAGIGSLAALIIGAFFLALLGNNIGAAVLMGGTAVSVLGMLLRRGQSPTE